MQPEAYYNQRIAEAGAELRRVKGRILRVSGLRVLLFVAGVVGLILFFKAGVGALCLVVLVTFVPFLALVKYHNRLFYRKDWWEACFGVNGDELRALQDDYTPFDGGAEFIDPGHRYAFDLDLFGPHSLFQALNRTTTFMGKQTLARWLQEHLEQKQAIERRQQAVRELASLVDLREAFRITGLLYKGAAGDREELARWIASPVSFSHTWWARPVLWAVPTVDVCLLALGLAGVLPLLWFGVVFCLFVVAGLGLVRRVSQLQAVYDKKLRVLCVYAGQMRLIENHPLQAKLLQSLQACFTTGGKPATAALHALSRELERLELRNNQLLYVLLEGSLFWQLRQVLRIERWRGKYGPQLLGWLDALGEVDALCSMGTFCYNHPDYVFPTIADRPFVLRARQMGHPLIPAARCVKNDADIPSRPFFVIITGANMAGKSTYLRTIGVNYVLACTGAPVCCEALELYPAKLVTNLRTDDSLTRNESYFFAELKRLKQIIDRLQCGECLFVMLDEILKGTNSTDKQKGSFALVRQLMQLHANGIIATHDLLLGQLADSFPGQIRNNCFEADIVGESLHFSYRLRDGIAQHLNACFLMKKMGLDVD